MPIQTIFQNSSDSRMNSDSEKFNPHFGLQNLLREELLKKGLGDVALILDALFCSGVIAGTTFTFEEALKLLTEVGFTVSQGLIRRALKSEAFQFVVLQNGRKGRPEIMYKMPEVMALINRYADGALSGTDPLMIEDMKDLTHYRQALLREFLRRIPKIYNQEFISQKFGVTTRTISNYRKRSRLRQ